MYTVQYDRQLQRRDKQIRHSELYLAPLRLKFAFIIQHLLL